MQRIPTSIIQAWGISAIKLRIKAGCFQLGKVYSINWRRSTSEYTSIRLYEMGVYIYRNVLSYDVECLSWKRWKADERRSPIEEASPTTAWIGNRFQRRGVC